MTLLPDRPRFPGAAPRPSLRPVRPAGTEADLAGRLDALPLADKVSLLTGATPWRLRALDTIGLRSVVVSDGPAGVRGTGEVSGETSASFPAPSALAATWDVGLAARAGDLFAAEARAHGVDVVLAPVVNLQRTPVGGRHFECFSEDPLLTSLIAGALVEHLQAAGVAACAKHFVANDSETGRTDYVAVPGERALREVYLAPFEHLVLTSGVWTVMAAYNGLDDGTETATATEHTGLLRGVLKNGWGFDGVVMSDWLATRSVAPAAGAGLDLVMPGPGGPWSAGLLDAVLRGAVDEADIDDKVLRILRLAGRVGALAGAERLPVRSAAPDDATTRAVLRELAARSTVVLRDERRALPLTPRPGLRIALLGPNAVDAFVQGGGSANVTPRHVVTPAEGLRAALPDAEVLVLRGGDARRHAPDLAVETRAEDPAGAGPGLLVELLSPSGEVISSAHHSGPWPGWLRDAPAEAAAVRIRTVLSLDEPGDHWVGVGTVGRHSVVVDGVVVGSDDHVVGAEVVLDSSVNSPDDVGIVVRVTEPRRVLLEATVQNVVTDGYGHFARAALRHRPPEHGTEAEIEQAVAAAASADVVVVVVGTNDEVESEGWDRTSLRLPGRQDDLVERVLDVAPDAVVVVNAGAPLVLPWLDRAATVLWTWFPGQECGAALADVLLGVTEPSGRLPWTLPAEESDVPVPSGVPASDGRLVYAEGIHVGYRSWERLGRRPAAPFGHGLGWTSWDYERMSGAATPDGLTVVVRVRNVGPRTGHEVVQVYLEAPAGGPERPVRWLGGFTCVQVPAGEARDVVVDVPRRALEVWDVGSGGWCLPHGGYGVRAGRSVGDLRLRATVDV